MNQKYDLSPFVKWVGGKTQSISQILPLVPQNIDYYIEPFIGGGAIFLRLLDIYNFKKSIICDKNKNLIKLWKIIKSGSIEKLIHEIKIIENNFNSLETIKEKSDFYYKIRNYYNGFSKNDSKYLLACYFIFLNKTCFNGIYRENQHGHYNVPFGYKNTINLVDEKNLYKLKAKLKNTIIICDDFSKVNEYVSKYNFDPLKTLYYLDPPYKSIKKNFTKYLHTDFLDSDQERLELFVKKISKSGFKYILSNSNDLEYFESKYKNQNITKIKTRRMINCIGSKRMSEHELLIHNILERNANG